MHRFWVHAVWLATTAVRIGRWGIQLQGLVKPSHRPRLGLVVVVLWCRLLRVPVRIPSLWLTIGGVYRRISIGTHHELAAAVEVLCSDDYAVPIASRDVSRIIDLGANAGFATLLFAGRYPEARIVAVEPTPDTCARLRGNTSGLPYITVCEFAIGDPGSIRFDLAAPSTERRGRPTGDGIDIERRSLGHLLESLGWDTVDVVKVDVEGDEYAIFEDPALGLAQFVVGELHPAAEPASFGDLASALPRFDVAVSHNRPTVMFRAVRRAT